MTVSEIAAVPAFGRFFLPGPTEVRPEILAAQVQAMIGHRGKAMEALIAELQPGLRRIFRTSRPVYIAASSATGLMEAAIRNCAGRRVLSLVNGAFSERFYRIALAHGVETVALEVPLGAAHTPEMVAEALAKESYDAVTVVHSETSTGVLNPIRELAEVVHRKPGRLLLVDSVTGVAGAQVESDSWGLDFVLTGPRRHRPSARPALEWPSPPPWSEPDHAQPWGHFDLVEFESFIVKNQTPATPALSLMYALAAQVERIEGKESRLVGLATKQWRSAPGWAETEWPWAAFEVLAPEGYRSPTVTCIKLPSGMSGSAVDKEMKRRGYTISPGYGALKDSTIRIGHMGDHTVDELNELLQVLEDVIRS
jgi:aspartate aminotransferase-like enzyme